MKQTLLSIKRKTIITTQAIAERAHLPVADVFIVETGGFSSREKAQKVLTAFNQLSGMQVRLEDIALHPTEPSPSQPTRKAIAPVKIVPVHTQKSNQEGRP